MKTDLEAVTFETSLDTVTMANVAIWRNQANNADYPGSYPAIFVEFLNTQYTEGNSKAYQEYDLAVRLHLCLSTTEDEEETLLIFKFADAVFSKMQLKQYGSFSAMKRRAESTVFNYDAVQDYIQDYSLGSAKDYGADKRPTATKQITEIIIEPDLTNEIDG